MSRQKFIRRARRAVDSAAFHREGKSLVVEASLLEPDDLIRVVYSSGDEVSIPAVDLFSDDEPSAPRRLVEIPRDQAAASVDFYESIGPWVTGRNVEQHFGVSRQRVAQWRAEGKVLGVQFGDRRFYYPAGQFQYGTLVPNLRPVLKVLSPHFETETIASFLSAPVEGSEGSTYWTLLQEGEADMVGWAHRLVGHSAA